MPGLDRTLSALEKTSTIGDQCANAERLESLLYLLYYSFYPEGYTNNVDYLRVLPPLMKRIMERGIVSEAPYLENLEEIMSLQ